MRNLPRLFLIFTLCMPCFAQERHHIHDPNTVEFWNDFRATPGVKILSVDNDKVNWVFITKYEDWMGSVKLTPETIFQIKDTGKIMDRKYFDSNLKHLWGFFYCAKDGEALVAYEMDIK